MKNICFLLLILVQMAGFTQDNGTWSISAHFQSDHNFIPMIQNDVYWHTPEPMLHERFYYTGGVGVNYRFANQFELSSGIRYSKKREDFNSSNYFICGDINLPFSSIIPFTRHYLEVPVLARYYFLPGKVKIHVESGWIGSYRLDRFSESHPHDWMISAQTGIGVNWFLNRWQFGLGANHRLQFDLGERNVFFVMNPNVFGIEFKTAFSLNN